MTTRKQYAEILCRLEHLTNLLTEMRQDINSFCPAEALYLDESVIHRALQLAADHYAITVPELFLRCRQLPFVDARMLAMFLIREATSLSFPAIARRFARDSGTVINACRRIQGFLDTDPKFRASVATMLATLQTEPRPSGSVPPSALSPQPLAFSR